MTAETDYIVKLGTTALASRLRRLLNRLLADGELVYQNLGIDFKIKWFPVLHLLANHSSMTVTQMAATLNMAHPSIIEVSEDMKKEKLVISQFCPDDKRKRELRLTDKGRRLYFRLQPIWAAFKEAGAEVNYEFDNDFLKAVGKLEAAIEEKSMHDRIISILGRKRKQ